METKTIFIWILSILSLFLVVAVVILGMKNRKLTKQPIEQTIQNYVNSLPVYSNNADALANGLTAGAKYRTSATATMYSIVTAS